MKNKTALTLTALAPFGILEGNQALFYGAIIIAVALLAFLFKAKDKTVIAFDVGGVMTTGDYMTGKFTGRENMKRLVKRLRNKYKVVALTNDNTIAYPTISKAIGMDNVFDRQFVSSEIGAKKPDKRAFTFLLDRFGLKPRELVFVDDKQENVASAKSLGIRAFHFTSPEKLVADLRGTNITI